MPPKTISFCQGKGSISHNNREFNFKNVDSTRTPDNVVYIKQSIADAYEWCFGDAVSRYNNNQTRSDRKIQDSYYRDLFGVSPDVKAANVVRVSSNKQKSFYEDLVQIGTKDDSGVGSVDGEVVARCLDEYMRGFSERNPNFYVFNAVLHLDEATPHLHIDYIPIGHYNRGMDTQNGLARALKEMGYGGGKDAINRWRIAERRELEHICRKNGIEIAEFQKSRGYSLLPEDYKTQKDHEREALILEQKNLHARISDLRAIYEMKERTHIKLLEDKKEALRSAYERLERQLKVREVELSEKVAELDKKLGELQFQTEKVQKHLANFEKGRKTRQSVNEIVQSGGGTITGRVTYTRENNDALLEYARVGSAAADRIIELERRLRIANGKLEPYEEKARAYDEIQRVRGRKPTLEETMKAIEIRRFMEVPERARKEFLDEQQMRDGGSRNVERSGHEER